MKRLIALNAGALNIGRPEVDPCRLLAAIAMVESHGGHDKRANYERAFDVHGRYFNEELTNKWTAGADPMLKLPMRYMVASSFGPWQIMFPVACELGFEGSPFELADPRTNLVWAIRYINRRCLPRMTAETEDGRVGQVASIYNSGRLPEKGRAIPYISKVIRHYRDPDLYGHLAALGPDYGLYAAQAA